MSPSSREVLEKRWAGVAYVYIPVSTLSAKGESSRPYNETDFRNELLKYDTHRNSRCRLLCASRLARRTSPNLSSGASEGAYASNLRAWQISTGSLAVCLSSIANGSWNGTAARNASEDIVEYVQVVVRASCHWEDRRTLGSNCPPE